MAAKSLRRQGRALTVTLLLLGAPALAGCVGDGPARDAKPVKSSSGAPHAVFSGSAGEQPARAVGRTRLSSNAEFSQRLTFTTPNGDIVLTTAGRLDFAAGRATVTSDWSLPSGTSGSIRERVLGSALGSTEGEDSARIEVDGQFIHYRPEGAAYWLRYADRDEKAPVARTVSRLRGLHAPFGGLLLEAVQDNAPTRWDPAPEGGRMYRTQGSLGSAAENILPLGDGGPSPNSTAAGKTFPLTMTTDAKGRVVRAEADLSALRPAARSMVGKVTGIRAVLTLSGYGSRKPAARPVGDKVLTAAGSVRFLDQLEAGDCADGHTGLRSSAQVVLVTCGAPHDARVLGQVTLAPGPYPEEAAVRHRATEACRRVHRQAPARWTGDSAAQGHYWSVWTGGTVWKTKERPRATCYVMSR